jgi:hypothetical protein
VQVLERLEARADFIFVARAVAIWKTLMLQRRKVFHCGKRHFTAQYGPSNYLIQQQKEYSLI